jgi:type I restriction enzyme R subunit
MQQALEYAAILNILFANGDGFVFHDQTRISPEMESKLELDGFPCPETLWNISRSGGGGFQDYFDNGSDSDPRYYRRNAINVATVAIVKGKTVFRFNCP